MTVYAIDAPAGARVRYASTVYPSVEEWTIGRKRPRRARGVLLRDGSGRRPISIIVAEHARVEVVDA